MASETRGAFKTFTAGEALAANRRVKLDTSSGTQVVYADAEDRAIGVTDEAADSGANVSVRMLEGGGSFKVTASEAMSLGARAYGAADGKVSDVPANACPAEFELLEAASADGSIVEAIPYRKHSRVLHADVANGTSLENTTTETTLAGKTIQPADLSAGDVLEVIAQVWVEDNNSTDTLNVKLYVGTEEICATGAVDVADNDIAYIHAFITIRTTGASATLSATGVKGLGVPDTLAALPFYKASASEDLSSAFEVAIKGTWSVAHADNECESANFVVIHHPR